MDIAKLKAKGINCFKPTLQEYPTSVWNNESNGINIMITERPISPGRSFIHAIRSNSNVTGEGNEREVSAFASFKKQVLVPGVISLYFRSSMTIMNGILRFTKLDLKLCHINM